MKTNILMPIQQEQSKSFLYTAGNHPKNNNLIGYQLKISEFASDRQQLETLKSIMRVPHTDQNLQLQQF